MDLLPPLPPGEGRGEGILRRAFLDQLGPTPAPPHPNPLREGEGAERPAAVRYGLMSIFGYRAATSANVCSFQYRCLGAGKPTISRCRGVARWMNCLISGFSPNWLYW